MICFPDRGILPECQYRTVVSNFHKKYQTPGNAVEGEVMTLLRPLSSDPKENAIIAVLEADSPGGDSEWYKIGFCVA